MSDQQGVEPAGCRTKEVTPNFILQTQRLILPLFRGAEQLEKTKNETAPDPSDYWTIFNFPHLKIDLYMKNFKNIVQI